MSDINDMSVFAILYARLVMRERISIKEVPKCFLDDVNKILEMENKDKRVP